MPNFCNLGVLLRTLLLVNAVALAATLLRLGSLSDLVPRWLAVAAGLEPVLLLVVFLSCALHDPLARLGTRQGRVLWLALLPLAALLSAPVRLASPSGLALFQDGLAALLLGVVVLGYFDWRDRSLSPAVLEARLQALQARIRPHFLFNTLNTVLSLIRHDPVRAERALEDLADLLRVFMHDNRELVPLGVELRLCRQILGIERLRLGGRLRISIEVAEGLERCLVPPLLLQPLVENAIYHGIEPQVGTGTLTLRGWRARGRLHLVLENPLPAAPAEAGNGLALENIRQRLMLIFDAEAQLLVHARGDRFQVHLVLPEVLPNVP